MVAALLATVSAQAQERSISGSLTDRDTKEPVMQATVQLLKTDSTFITGSLSNEEGKFSLTAPENGKYLVKISGVGYKPIVKNVNIQDDKNVDLGSLTFGSDAIMLKGVTATAQAAKVTVKKDTFIYNAAAYRTPEGSVAEELVKKLPGAQVDDDGKITINGKTVKKILVDGKEFMTGDTQTAMKNLPTYIINNIRAYDQQSDLARVTGIDDGNEETVLDFGIKPGMNRGFFANADLGAGTKGRYSSRLMGSYQNSTSRITGMFNANNTNDMGFPGGGGGGRFGGRNGLNASKMTGLNFNYDNSKNLELDASLRWNHSDGDTWSRSATENFGSNQFSNSLSKSLSRSNNWNAQLRLEWRPDSMTNVMFRPSLRVSSSDSRRSPIDNVSATFDADPYLYVADPLATASIEELVADEIVVNTNRSGSLSNSSNTSANAMLQINRRLSKNGRNVTLRGDFGYGDQESKSLSLSEVNYYKTQLASGNATQYTNRYNLTPTKNWNYSIQTTYSEPIAKRTYLQFSYQFRYSYNKSDRSTYTYSPLGDIFSGIEPVYGGFDDYLSLISNPVGTDSPYYDENQSRFSEYKNYIHTGEVMLRVVRDAYNFNVGVQLVPQTSKFTYRYLGVDYGTTTRNVVNWSPTANFRWKISDQGQMRFQYRGNTSQPSMSDLLEITDDSDPLNVTIGNKGLKPSFTQTFNWRYNNYFQRHQQFIFANLSFSTTSNDITSKVYYDPLTGGRTSTRDNINGNWNTRGEIMFNTALDTLGRFNFNTRTTAGYTHSVSYLDANRDGSIMKNAVNETVLGERLGFSYRNDWFEFEPNGAVNYTFGRNKLQAQGNQDTWNFSYGFNTTAQLPWGMQLTTNLNMTSRRGFSDESMNTNELIWNAQIAQSFLRGKPLSVRLEFYDILGQQSSFTRTLNAMMRSDSESNAINSYVMLRVNYRLNLFAGMGNMGGGRGGRGGSGGFGGGRGGRGGGGFGGPGRF